MARAGIGSTAVACISPRGGLLVGSYQAHSGSRLRGFTDRHGAFRTMPVPAARLDTFADCGKDLGRVVGFFVGQAGLRGFLFTPGRSAAAAQHWQAGPRLTQQASSLRLRLGLGLGMGLP